MSHSHPGRQTVCCKSHGYKPACQGEKNLLLETAIMALVHQNRALKAKTMREPERFLHTYYTGNQKYRNDKNVE